MIKRKISNFNQLVVKIFLQVSFEICLPQTQNTEFISIGVFWWTETAEVPLVRSWLNRKADTCCMCWVPVEAVLVWEISGLLSLLIELDWVLGCTWMAWSCCGTVPPKEHNERLRRVSEYQFRPSNCDLFKNHKGFLEYFFIVSSMPLLQTLL